MLEVALTRIFAVAQFHHFAFVAVSLALAALSWGFNVVMLAGAACYGGATLLATAKTRVAGSRERSVSENLGSRRVFRHRTVSGGGTYPADPSPVSGTNDT